MNERKIMLIDEATHEAAKESGIKLKAGEENWGEAHSMVIARLSQSAKPFKEILKETLTSGGFDKQKVSDFHRRITLGWKHHSIEQHAHTSVGFENVSILATNKYFENKRLASHLERSTRYQDFSKPNYYTPKELNEEQKKEYENAVKNLFDTYSSILPKTIAEITRDWKDRGIIADEKTIKKKAFDCTRYLLPCSAHTNFAMTANSQTFRSLIHDLLSEENAELTESAQELQKELEKVYPALCSKEICTADTKRREHKNKNAAQVPKNFKNVQNNVKLIDYTKNAEELICFEYLIKEGFNTEYSAEQGKVLLDRKELSTEQREKIMEKVFTYNSAEEKPHRAAELANYYFETTVDFGAGRDLHRNRMLTWIDTVVSPEYGYAVPYYLTKETREEYEKALTTAFECWKKLVSEGVLREIAQYVLPLATNYKVLYTINARELFHAAKTRTTNAAHYSYREYVHKLVEEVKRVQPAIGNNIKDYYAKEI